MKKFTIIIIIVLIILAAALFWQNQRPAPNGGAQTAGNVSEKSDLIVIESPRPGEAVRSPLEITGRARGNWFFEASFPIILVGEDGSILASHYATAEGEWMTEEFVRFTSTINFTVPEGVRNGTLILKKDNASGLPENDNELIVPVSFR